MFYNKLQGTTSSSFKLGKNGVNIETLQGGELRIVTKDYEFILGNDEVEGLLEDGAERTIASWQVVQSYIIEQVSGITGDVSEVDELLQQISGIAAALDNDPDFYLHVLRLQDVDGGAVDGQIVKGTTTFEKNITLGGNIIAPENFIIDPRPATGDPDGKLGKVIIHGDLQIDGETTTINSQTVEIFDKNITLASGAINAAAASGAGFTIDGTGATLASLLYNSSNDSFNFNRDLNVTKLNNLSIIAENNPTLNIEKNTYIGSIFRVGYNHQNQVQNELSTFGLLTGENASSYYLTLLDKINGTEHTAFYSIDGVTINGGTRTLDLSLFSGQNDPLSQTLKVNGLTSGRILYANATNEISSVPEMVFSNNNIGIGTASPAEKLEVTGNLKINSSATTGNAISITGNSLTTGKLLSLSSTSTSKSSGNDGMINLSSSGNLGSSYNFVTGQNINIYDYGQNADTFGLRMTLGRHDNYVPFDQNVTNRSTALLAEVHRSLRPTGFYFGAQSESASAIAMGGRIFAQTYGDNGYSTGLDILNYSVSKTSAANSGEAYGILIDSQTIKATGEAGTNRNSYGLYISAEAPEESKAYAIYSLYGINYFAGNTGIGQLPGIERLEVTGNTKSEQFVSTVTTASTRAPMIVSSKVLVQNLNADQLDGADLETVLTSNSDSKVPTSKAVADFAVSRLLTGYTLSEYDNATLTSDKLNSYVYVLNQDGISVRVKLSDVLRPSLYTAANNSEIDPVKVGDFVYTEIGGI
jgi:hypothetical protein